MSLPEPGRSNPHPKPCPLPKAPAGLPLCCGCFLMRNLHLWFSEMCQPVYLLENIQAYISITLSFTTVNTFSTLCEKVQFQQMIVCAFSLCSIIDFLKWKSESEKLFDFCQQLTKTVWRPTRFPA